MHLSNAVLIDGLFKLRRGACGEGNVNMLLRHVKEGGACKHLAVHSQGVGVSAGPDDLRPCAGAIEEAAAHMGLSAGQVKEHIGKPVALREVTADEVHVKRIAVADKAHAGIIVYIAVTQDEAGGAGDIEEA